MTTAPSTVSAQTLPLSTSERVQREGIRPPKFASKFAVLDFEASPAPIISMFEPPAARELEHFRLALRDDSLKTRIISWAELGALPMRDLEADLVCQIFNWHERITWTGFRVADVLAAFEVDAHPEGYLKFSSADGQYFETLSLDDARDPRVMLVTGMNGEPLRHEYGGPVRLVVPFLQGYKSVKWVDRIEAFRHDPAGIKRLLGQSKTSAMGQAWIDRLAIVPSTGRRSDP